MITLKSLLQQGARLPYQSGLDITTIQNMPPHITLSHGKVKDGLGSMSELLLYHSDRLSAYDQPVANSPYRGEMLCRLASFWFERLHEVPHHYIDQPSHRVMVVKKMRPIAVEVIVRGAFCGSMVQDVQRGHRAPYLHYAHSDALSELKPFDFLPEPCVHLTTKAAGNHRDTAHSIDAFLQKNLISKTQWQHIQKVSMAIFNWGQELFAAKGWILADTKFEFGTDPTSGTPILMDEILTPDTSRIWKQDPLTQKPMMDGETPKSWDKDILRRYLKKAKKSSEKDLDSTLNQLTSHYLEFYESITETSLMVSPAKPHDPSSSFAIPCSVEDLKAIKEWLKRQ